MKQLITLSITQIEKWGLTVGQLKAYLQAELRRHQELLLQLQQAELELSKLQETRIRIQQGITTEMETVIKNGEVNSIMSAIVNLRAQNVGLQAQIRATKNRIKEEQQVIKVTSGTNKHDKYSRVMSNVSHAADLREIWDSDDVLAIDDYVVENGVTYDEAKEAIERRKQTVDSSQELSDEE